MILVHIITIGETVRQVAVLMLIIRVVCVIVTIVVVDALNVVSVVIVGLMVVSVGIHVKICVPVRMTIERMKVMVKSMAVHIVVHIVCAIHMVCAVYIEPACNSSATVLTDIAVG